MLWSRWSIVMIEVAVVVKQQHVVSGSQAEEHYYLLAVIELWHEIHLMVLLRSVELDEI